jgi:DNA-binding transcriptional regulator PaaX
MKQNIFVKSVIDSLFGTTTDLVLWTIVYMGELSLPGNTFGKLWRAQRKADSFLDHTNYQTILTAIKNARRRGLIINKKRQTFPEISEAGRKRLSAIIPFYDEKRKWDNKIYLVTYDIPEIHHYDRDLLRLHLLTLGAGKLQDSVWITPYDPTDTLRDYISQHGINGNVIISSIGKDGWVGEGKLEELVIRIYHLDKLNDRYRRWLNENRKKDMLSVISFMSILRDDPQLPFSLLPRWWVGDRAYNKIEPLFKKVSLHLRP